MPGHASGKRSHKDSNIFELLEQRGCASNRDHHGEDKMYRGRRVSKRAYDRRIPMSTPVCILSLRHAMLQLCCYCLHDPYGFGGHSCTVRCKHSVVTITNQMEIDHSPYLERNW